jgi:hypothetical protein
MSNEPRWLSKEEFENETNTNDLENECLVDIIAGVFCLNEKWFFVGRDFEGVNGPYDSYLSATKSCLDYLENDPHWITDEEMADLIIEHESFLSLSTNSTTTIGGKWYFYDETGSELFGPYKTREEAQEAQKKYSDTL